MNVQHWNDGLNVTCIFSNTLSEKCYVQVVTDAVSGFHEGEYLEGEERASHSFTGLWPGTYTVLVYGMDREEVFILHPSDGPDYVSLVNVGGPQETPVATEIPMPSMNCHYHWEFSCLSLSIFVYNNIIGTPMGSSLFAEGTSK